MTQAYDLLCISTVITDILGFVEEDFLWANNLKKGMRSLVDQTKSEELYKKLCAVSNKIEVCAGGAGANTLSCFSSMGGKSAFTGPFYEDELGKIFKSCLKDKGVDFIPLPSDNHKHTARCLVFITPDSERTMQTHLGASNDFGDLWDPFSLVGWSKRVLLEAYFFDEEKIKSVLLRTAEAIKKTGGQIVFTASDPSLMRHNRNGVLDFLSNFVTIFIANRHEMEALLGMQEEAPGFYDRLKELAPVVIMTKNKDGSVIVSGKEKIALGIAHQKIIVDSTGAGDAYAAGFLYGLAHNHDLHVCGKMATLAAAEIISTVGAHPKRSMASVIHKDNFAKVSIQKSLF